MMQKLPPSDVKFTQGSAEVGVAYLIRHGRVDNPANVRYGRRPGFGLSHRGWREAHEVRRLITAEQAQGAGLQGVYRSPLMRTAQTAEILNQTLGLPMSVCASIHEIDEAGESVGDVVGRMRRFLWGRVLKGVDRFVLVGHCDPIRLLLMDLTGRGMASEANRLDRGRIFPLPTGGVYRVSDPFGPSRRIELLHPPEWAAMSLPGGAVRS
jgi:broad specificity phosphatase PhoE